VRPETERTNICIAPRFGSSKFNEARRSVHALRPDALERDNFGSRSKEYQGHNGGTALHTLSKLRGKFPELRDLAGKPLHIGRKL